MEVITKYFFSVCIGRSYQDVGGVTRKGERKESGTRELDERVCYVGTLVA